MENFRDRPGDAPDAPADAHTDTAADRADKPAVRFADGSRVRPADLELSPDAKPPPDAEDKREAYLREYTKQLVPADTGEALLPDEYGGASQTLEQGAIGDKVRAAVDKGRVAADRVLGGDAPDEAVLRVDRPWSDDPYTEKWPPTDYKPDALDNAEGKRTPLFDGRPKREDTAQRALGDCGVIASLGALAGNKPEKIADAIKQNPDGTYSVRLYRTSSAYENGLSSPGRPYTYTVTPDLPAEKDNGQTITAAHDTVAWPAIMEKAIAGSDQTWTPEQKQAYEARWDVQKAVMSQERLQEGKPPLPDGPTPTGYVRLNLGTTAWDRAEILTAVTGRQAEVRNIPDDDNELIKSIFTDKLAYDKPVLVGSRPRDVDAGEHYLPHGLDGKHVYEVTGINSDNRIELRNPWNHSHPDPLTLDEFREYFRYKHADGSRSGQYTTLT